jgi:hypothetical protein
MHNYPEYVPTPRERIVEIIVAIVVVVPLLLFLLLAPTDESDEADGFTPRRP